MKRAIVGLLLSVAGAGFACGSGSITLPDGGTSDAGDAGTGPDSGSVPDAGDAGQPIPDGGDGGFDAGPTLWAQSPTTPIAVNPGAPIVLHATETLAPNQVAQLYGAWMGTDGGAFTATAWRLPDDPISGPPETAHYFDPANDAGTAATILASSGVSADVVIPAAFDAGLFALQLINADGGSAVIFLNRAEPWWWIGGPNDLAYPGGTLRVFGKNLGGAQAWLAGDGGATALTYTPSTSNPWSATFQMPAQIPAGSYSLYVLNGFGGNFGFGPPLAVTVGASAPTFPTNVAAMLSPSGGDDTAAIQAALDDAAEDGGGVVALSAGTFQLTDPLVMPPNTVLQGAAMTSTTLVNNAVNAASGATSSVILGTSQFELTGFTLQSNSAHRMITCPNDPNMFNDYGLGAGPAIDCSDVLIDTLLVQQTTPYANYQGAADGCSVIITWGSDITVQSSELHSTAAMTTALYHAHHVVLSNNQFYNGDFDSFFGADACIYENNLHTAEPGSWGDGMFDEGYSNHVYYGGNTVTTSLGTYGEGIVIGDTPYYPDWWGSPLSSTVTTVTVADAGWTLNQLAGDAFFVLGGTGAYQRELVASNTGDTLTFAAPLAIPLDGTSLAAAMQDHFQNIAYGNSFQDVSVSVLLYSESDENIVDGNQSIDSGGAYCVGWNFGQVPTSYSPTDRSLNLCLFNEWTHNQIAGSLDASNPNKDGGLVYVNYQGQSIYGTSEFLADTANLGTVIDDAYMEGTVSGLGAKIPFDFLPPTVGNVIRDNTLSAVDGGPGVGSGFIGGIYAESSSPPTACPAMPSDMPNGGASGTLVEGNSISDAPTAIYFWPLYSNTLIRNNTFAGDAIDVQDYSQTTCF